MQSDSIKELVQAIVKAQSKLKPVKKETNNPFFNKKYADLAAVMDALKVYTEEGIAITQSPMPCEKPNHIAIVTQLTHTSGEWMRSTLELPMTKNDPQGAGSAITYARRYALGCMTGLVTEEDDDGNSHAEPPASRQGSYAFNKTASAKALAAIRTNDQPKEVPFNPEVCPPAEPQGIDNETWQQFCEYVGGDPDRTRIGKKVKAKMSVGELSMLPPKGRKAVMLSIQDEAKRQGVPFEQWVTE